MSTQADRQTAVRHLLAVAGVALVGVGVAACGSSKSASPTTAPVSGTARLNTAKVAKAIELSILEQRHLHSTVTCPANEPQVRGTVFTCIATGKLSNGTPYHTPFTVEVESNRGYVYYHS